MLRPGQALGGVEHWSELEPCPRMVRALDAARESATDARRRASSWSRRLADACSRMVADEVRERPFAREFTVLPDAAGGARQPSMVVWERGDWKRRRIDVVVGDVVRGLQVGVSVRAAGPDDGDELIERLFEVETDTEQLHAYRAEAVIAAVCFVPLSWATDGDVADPEPSRFARLVSGLRGNADRDSVFDQDQWKRLDLAFVALYVPGDPERFSDPKSGEVRTYDDPFPRGVVRYFDVLEDPPRRGRPKCEVTLSLDEVVDRIAERFTGGEEGGIEWAECERDPPFEYPAPPER